jgi:hypothetical protein
MNDVAHRRVCLLGVACSVEDPGRVGLPSSSVTFLFTDVERSTSLL